MEKDPFTGKERLAPKFMIVYKLTGVTTTKEHERKITRTGICTYLILNNVTDANLGIYHESLQSNTFAILIIQSSRLSLN